MQNSTAEWISPAWWEAGTVQPLPLLSKLRLHTIAFVTDRRPSAAVALAAKFNPAVQILVLAPRAQREHVLALNVSWADSDVQPNLWDNWNATYRQGAPGARGYHHFCHMRWLTVAAHLRAWPMPADGAIAVVDDDVLLFEDVDSRLREAAAFHPTAQAEVVVSGAFLLASAGALARFAAFLWALYALPVHVFTPIVWRFGEHRTLAGLNKRDRLRIDPAYHRGARFARFSDMDAIEAFRKLSRETDSANNVVLPTHLVGGQWAAGYRRPNCAHASKVEKLGLTPAGIAAGLNGEHRNAEASAPDSRRLTWREHVPHLQPTGQPLCFLHLQGPMAKNLLLNPMLREAGIRQEQARTSSQQTRPAAAPLAPRPPSVESSHKVLLGISFETFD